MNWLSENVPPPTLWCTTHSTHGQGGCMDQLSKAFDDITQKVKKTTAQPVMPDDVPNNPMVIPPWATCKSKKVYNQIHFYDHPFVDWLISPYYRTVVLTKVFRTYSCWALNCCWQAISQNLICQLPKGTIMDFSNQHHPILAPYHLHTTWRAMMKVWVRKALGVDLINTVWTRTT